METADLRLYLRILRKRWWIIAIALVGTLAGAVLLTARETPVYEAEAKVFVGLAQVSEQDLSAGAQRLLFAQQLMDTYAIMMGTRPVAESAVELAHLPLTAKQVSQGVKVARVELTQVLSVTFSSTSPVVAARTANAVTEAFETRVESIGRADGGEAAVKVETLESAEEPSSPVRPNPRQNILVGMILGLGLGIGLAFLVEAFEVTVKSREDVEALGLPLIGAIPRLETQGVDVYLEGDSQGLGGEAFRKLRTAIGFLSLEKPVQVILVTSGLPGEGKTMCALNVASAYAQGGLRTVLVEADLRRPTLHRFFGTDGTIGLTTAIIGDVPVEEAVRPTSVANLSIMLAGGIPPNPVELLDSAQMVGVLTRLRALFDIVILDTPPIVPVADPAALAARVDGVVLVARAGSTHRKRLVESAELIDRAGGRLLGVLLNRLRPQDAPHEYEYYYTYRASGDAFPAQPSADRSSWTA